MDELGSSNLQIVLSIKEGKGFEQISQPTILIATLNGHSLESDIIEPNSNPQYATDLVWETDKTSLRKMRSGQTPLKLECFALKDHNNKEKIGYILLSIRSAQIILKSKEIGIKVNWHTLLGLRNDLKAQKPELLLSLSIEDREYVTSNSLTKLDYAQSFDCPTSKTNMVTPSLIYEERLIQLGPLNLCNEIFLLNIISNTVINLDALLLENSNGDIKENLSIWYYILENDVKLKPFIKDTEKTLILNEKIVVRIRSSLDTLRSYLLLKPYLNVSLKYKDNIVSQFQINLQPLINDIPNFLEFTNGKTTVLNERYYLNQTNIFHPIDIEHNQSYIDLQLKLQYVGSKENLNNHETNQIFAAENNMTFLPINKHNEEYKNTFDQKFTEIDMHRNPAGDFEKYTCERIISDHKNLAMHPTNCDMQENSIPVISQLPNSTDYSKSVEAYHCYCLDIILVAIKLSSGPATQNIEFRFHHPKAEIMSTVHSKMSVLLGEKVVLRDIGCKLHFISTTDEIKQLLVSFPPKISIYGMGEDVKTCIAQFSLDIKQLFHHDKWKYEYEMPLYNSEEIKVGELDIVVSLLDHGPYYRIKQNVSDQNFGPPIIDDSLAYKIVDELETWKERQKEIFRVELKKKEERHLNLLSEEWQRQKENLESKLACSVEQCKMLANNLNKATDDLRTRRLKNLEKEARLIKANEDLHWRYEAKIQELKESLRIMQEESTSKIRIFEEKNASLEARIEPLSIENEKLRQMITKQAEELEVYQKGSLTQDQTATLLQELKTLEEKYNNAQHNKTFFKEEWGKAVREIHRMKREHQQTIEIQIKNSKEELKNLGLEEILCADSTALTNDQILLGQIQKEIDVFKPSSLMKEKHQQILTPITEIFSKNSQTNIKTILHKPEEHDERLQALIEERDSLLKTGSYTNDDTVIVKLNTEIRNLLMNS
ncbi:hypothetical protein HZH68_007379 [Vespula germanica]|uniref:DUF3668 domain-containing protein n=1 Tax=Vespula germanica TaxID=30212 RepID=A0A834K6U0_VESGE|nr:hypothetical protein HZH68_007379 [Vespula germanica]